MTTARVTVSLPTELRDAAQEAAEAAGIPFSAVVSEALSAWTRARLVDSWLAEHETKHGRFDEHELRRLAKEAGVPYVPAERARRVS